MTKKILALILTLLFVSFNVLAYVDTNAPVFPLPKGKEVGKGLIVAIIAIPLALLIFSKSKQDSKASGCIGEILLIVGGIGLLPLLFWVFEVVNAVAFVVILIAIIAIIVSIIRKK